LDKYLLWRLAPTAAVVARCDPSQQGHGIGGVLQFHLYLDDLFPHSIGKPVFGD